MMQERVSADVRKPQLTHEDVSHQIETVEVKPVEKVCVVHGANQNYFNVAGLTVSQIKQKLRDVINVSADAEAYISSKLVNNEYVVQEGQHLEFLKDTGVKGKVLQHIDLRQI